MPREFGGNASDELDDDWAGTVAYYKRHHARGRKARDQREHQAEHEAYQQGAREERQRLRDADRERAHRRRSAAVKAKARSTRKRVGRRSVRPLTNVIVEQTASGMQTFVMTLGIVALYVALTNAGYVEGFLGGATRALKWLGNPTAGIPYKPGS